MFNWCTKKQFEELRDNLELESTNMFQTMSIISDFVERQNHAEQFPPHYSIKEKVVYRGFLNKDQIGEVITRYLAKGPGGDDYVWYYDLQIHDEEKNILKHVPQRHLFPSQEEPCLKKFDLFVERIEHAFSKAIENVLSKHYKEAGLNGVPKMKNPPPPPERSLNKEDQQAEALISFRAIVELLDSEESSELSAQEFNSLLRKANKILGPLDELIKAVQRRNEQGEILTQIENG